MVQNKHGGPTTAKRLDLENDLSVWQNAAQAFLSGDVAQCPLCGAGLESESRCGRDRVGFLLFTCPSCCKSVNFSRVRFPENISVKQF